MKVGRTSPARWWPPIPPAASRVPESVRGSRGDSPYRKACGSSRCLHPANVRPPSLCLQSAVIGVHRPATELERCWNASGTLCGARPLPISSAPRPLECRVCFDGSGRRSERLVACPSDADSVARDASSQARVRVSGNGVHCPQACVYDRGMELVPDLLCVPRVNACTLSSPNVRRGRIPGEGHPHRRANGDAEREPCAVAAYRGQGSRTPSVRSPHESPVLLHRTSGQLEMPRIMNGHWRVLASGLSVAPWATAEITPAFVWLAARGCSVPVASVAPEGSRATFVPPSLTFSVVGLVFHFLAFLSRYMKRPCDRSA